MHGVRRVISFCALTTILPITILVIPLYLRHNLYADVVYAVTESDILEISDGVSTIFCSAHTLQMNGTFNAFQMGHRPEVTSYRKHIRLKKSMILPDDTLEYWGFYLLRGATVALSVCSRFPGSSILVVKGERTLRTCGLLDHNMNKARKTGIFLPQADQQVKITFESNAQVIDFEEPTKTHNSTHHKNSKPKFTANSAAKSIKLTEEDSKKQISEDEELASLTKTAEYLIRRNLEKSEHRNLTRKVRHLRSRSKKRGRQRADSTTKLDRKAKKLKKLNNLKKELSAVGADKGGEEPEEGFNIIEKKAKRFKRNQEPLDPPALLDHGIQHGGNNAPKNFSDISASSFEEGLFQCYEGQVLLAQEFDPSELCTNVSWLVNSKHMEMRHDVAEDGYYYYIFYSDNDIVFNDMHAVFDIYKPTFQYENVSKSCVNKTECTFPLTMLSNDRVVVEVPTKDGIDHEQDDISLLISVCHPRMGMYTIFPIAVLFLILSCAFV